MKCWVALAASVIGLAGLCAVSGAHAAPQLQWGSKTLTINAVKGQLVREPVTVLATQHANNVRAELKGQASEVLTIAQPDVGSISPGTSLTLMVETRLPAGERRRQLQGLLQLRESGKPHGVLASPLPVRVVVNESSTSKLIVSAKDEDGLDVSPATQVWLDGKVVARFEGQPTVTVPASPGQHRVAVYDPMVAGAVASVHLDLGEEESVHLTTKSGGLALVDEYQAVVAEAVGGIVPGNFSTFTIRLQRPDGTRVVSTYLSSVSVTPVAQESLHYRARPSQPTARPSHIARLFALSPDGTEIVATKLSELRAELGTTRQMELRVTTGNEETGLEYDSFVRIMIGRHRVEGQLLPPPSNMALAVANLPVRLRTLGTEFEQMTTTDAEGGFVFPFVPSGPAELYAQTASEERQYASFGTVMMDRNRYPQVTLLHSDDVVAGVPELVLQQPVGKHSPDVLDGRERDARFPKRQAWVPGAGKSVDESVTVEVHSSAQDTAVGDTQVLQLDNATTTLTLRYQVGSEEYPFYVGRQSQYNDTWNLEVRGPSGAVLFQTTHNVNSQLAGAPQWLNSGTTGEITEVIDVSALPLPQTGSRQVQLTARTTNIGDSTLTTVVHAVLASEEALVITASDATTSPYVSIPRPGQANTTPLEATIIIKSPTSGVTTADVSMVSSDLQLANGQNQRIVDTDGVQAPVAAADDSTMNATITYGGANPAISAIPSTPPTANGFGYEFTVEAPVSGQAASAEAALLGKQAYWRMPDGFPRYSEQEPAGDDWCVAGTYQWMEQHRALLTAINDISGEHNTNLGHTTHLRGTDIDIFQFGVHHGASGNANYAAIAQMALAAAGGSAADAATLTTWIQAQRDGIQNILNAGQVSQVRAARGRVATQGTVTLPDGWLEQLFRTGQVIRNGVVVLDLGGGYTNTAIAYDHVHNNHIHVDLDDSAFRNLP